MSANVEAPRAGFLKYSLTIGVAAMEGRGFYYPVDVAIRTDGRLFVLGRAHDGDPRGVQVLMCNLDSEYYGVFGSGGEGDGQFVWPTAIAVDAEGRIYVSDEHTNRISVFDRSGLFLSKWGVHGSDEGEIDGPSGMAFDASGSLWVVDHRNNRVQQFSRDGRYIGGFGSEGAGEGQFNLPWGIAIDPRGEVFVADWRNDRVQRFSPDGRHLATYGGPGRADGEFYRPSSVAVDSEGYVYVADWGNERVQVLDAEGRFVTMLRGQATTSRWAQDFLDANAEEAEARSESDLEPDLEFLGGDPHEESYHTEKFFWSPVSVKLDGAGRLYVTDRNRHRLQVYERA